MKIKEFLNKSWVAFIAVCGVISLAITIMLKYGVWKATAIIIAIFLVTCIFLGIGYTIVSGKIGAWWAQKKMSGFQGLWQDKNLSQELKRNFKTAQTIKIKVTRGSELFDINQSGNITQFLKDLMDTASSQREIKCQLLLISPCYKLRHVKERHEISNKEYPEAWQFLKSWYDTLESVKKIESEKSNVHFHMEVRFYSGRHSKWRFYIFDSINKTTETVLFCDYDVDRRAHGTKLPMYKVLKNELNIGGFMKRYFEEIWSVALKPEDFKQLVLEGNCMQRFCEECESVSAQSCLLCQCPSKQCDYESYCKDYVNQRL